MTDHVVVEADGGSRGNPGPAGYGAVVRDAGTGRPLREAAGGIGVASNNVAEYRGLIAGLEVALDLGASRVDVRMDSKLVVEQMSGRWKVKHPDMRVLASEAMALVRRFDSVGFAHIPRAQNAHADRLANEAMDAQAAGRDWAPPASEVDEPSTPDVPDPKPAPNVLYGWSAPAGRPTVATLLRHGETPLSLEKRFSGRGDAALTERGRAQALAAAQRLASSGIEAIVSSPLRRTQETAAIVADVLGLPVETDDGFAETDFGEWEGLTFGEVGKDAPEALRRWLEDPTIAPPGGESLAATATRVAVARDRAVAAYPDRAVLVVSHVTPIKLMLRDAVGAPIEAVYRLHLEPASLSLIDWYAESPAVVRLVNETHHLGDLATAAHR
ncbi:MAG TPA: bifunctional RNase H/acid phosphatase [Mycobacteriales bacterium]|nr:bifunctional RNase H/acid phosphatase [Mycobacteriales bacterium]